MFDPKELERLVREQLNDAIGDYINTLAGSASWMNELKQTVAAQVVRNISDEIKAGRFSNTVESAVKKLFEAHVAGGRGIDDQAEAVQLTVMDGAVVVENDFVANTIRGVESIVTDKLTVNELDFDWATFRNDLSEEVLQRVDSGLQDSITKRVIESAKSGIDFENVTIQGIPLVNGDTLSSRIKKTNISTVGTLNQLHVAGEALVHNTAYVGNKRVGINTQEPAMSLDVWDEEVQVSIGKQKERTAFIGSNRLQNLEIGVNGKGAITVTDKNLVIIDQLQIGKNLFSHGKTCPGYLGSKGDIVFNTDVSAKNPVFAWMCVGAYNWVALSATVS